MYSLVENKLVRVFQPEDAVELMEIIQKAVLEGKTAFRPKGKRPPALVEAVG